MTIMLKSKVSEVGEGPRLTLVKIRVRRLRGSQRSV